eukprot:COSAG01_NODE_27756_length_677_cov_2.375433_1_plen_160_part_00
MTRRSRFFQLDDAMAPPTVAMSVSTTHDDLHTVYVVRMRETGAERLQEGSKRHPGVGLRTATLRVVCAVDDGATSQPPPSLLRLLLGSRDWLSTELELPLEGRGRGRGGRDCPAQRVPARPNRGVRCRGQLPQRPRRAAVPSARPTRMCVCVCVCWAEA